MEEAKSELQIHPSHVVVPIAFFERVMEIYYRVKGGGIVGQEETPKKRGRELCLRGSKRT